MNPTDLEPNSSSFLPVPADRIPKAHHERYAEVAALLHAFNQAHLDAELSGYVRELWKRVCRLKTGLCLRGKPSLVASAVILVIARMNFLFDRKQPVHLAYNVIWDFSQSGKSTVGLKAKEIERALRLRQHAEPGLCRNDFLETFTYVRNSMTGMSLPFKFAKQMGYLPPGLRVEDLL